MTRCICGCAVEAHAMTPNGEGLGIRWCLSCDCPGYEADRALVLAELCGWLS